METNDTTKTEQSQEPREWRWWENQDGTPSTKLTNLEQAFAIGATDIEACAYADISERQFYYYCEHNPDFVSRKKQLKAKVFLKARKNIIDRINHETAKDSTDIEKLNVPADNSWKYLKSHSDEFADRVDPRIGQKMGNSITFVDYTEDEPED
jgi:hypothetical protein